MQPYCRCVFEIKKGRKKKKQSQISTGENSTLLLLFQQAGTMRRALAAWADS
jgi:hypothetical protein